MPMRPLLLALLASTSVIALGGLAHAQFVSQRAPLPAPLPAPPAAIVPDGGWAGARLPVGSWDEPSTTLPARQHPPVRKEAGKTSLIYLASCGTIGPAAEPLPDLSASLGLSPAEPAAARPLKPAAASYVGSVGRSHFNEIEALLRVIARGTQILGGALAGKFLLESLMTIRLASWPALAACLQSGSLLTLCAILPDLTAALLAYIKAGGSI